MFERFNLKIEKKQLDNDLQVRTEGIEKFKKNLEIDRKEYVNTFIDNFTLSEPMNGELLSSLWFPKKKWDIFISHSHIDEEIAVGLASWLEKSFDLKVFVDSIVWGSADKLLKLIDDKYCVLNEVEGKKTYDYSKRNYSTSHVHMMLSSALSEVIYNTECIIFLNTPNSLDLKFSTKESTNSPWIYNEIMISSIVTRTYPRYKEIVQKKFLDYEGFDKKINESLTINYDIKKQLKLFNDINVGDLIEWKRKKTMGVDLHPLDCLYLHVLKGRK